MIPNVTEVLRFKASDGAEFQTYDEAMEYERQNYGKYIRVWYAEHRVGGADFDEVIRWLVENENVLRVLVRTAWKYGPIQFTGGMV